MAAAHPVPPKPVPQPAHRLPAARTRRGAGTEEGAAGLRDFSADFRMVWLAALAVLAGLGGTLAAFLLLHLIGLVTHLAYSERIGFALIDLGRARLPVYAPLIPVLGGLAVGLMARFGSDKIRGHGIPEALESILIGGSVIPLRVAVLKPIASAIAIGTGGPFGAEGPIIMTGGAIGSLLATRLRLGPGGRKILLVAGAAAGMTAIFGTPVAAVLLALEVLLFEWKPRSLVPVVAAVAVASGLRPLLIGSGPLFPALPVSALSGLGLGVCGRAGVLAGLLAAALSAALYRAEDAFDRLPLPWMWWPALGGLVGGIGGWLDPRVLGVGYAEIKSLIAGTLAPQPALQLLGLKAVVWIVALASGTSGGVLAPLLIVGGCLGAVAAPWLGLLAPAGFWGLLAMSATLAGALRAPLTATLFAVELTGNLPALPGLLVASVAAHATTVLLMRRSILTERLSRRGLHLSQEYASDPLAMARVRDVMHPEVLSLPGEISPAAALAQLAAGGTRLGIFPVLAADGALLGLVRRTELAAALDSKAGPAGRCVADLVDPASLCVGYADEPASLLADRMEAKGAARAPILDRASARLVGLVSARDLLRARARG